MTYQLSALTLKDVATMDKDAKSCYDRIVILLALLRSRQIGMPKEACEFLAKFFNDAKYYVKTKTGVSAAYHMTTELLKIFGSGQGNGSLYNATEQND